MTDQQRRLMTEPSTIDDDMTCQFTIRDGGNHVITHCHRQDYEVVYMGDGDYVRLCPKHRSWAVALGKP